MTKRRYYIASLSYYNRGNEEKAKKLFAYGREAKAIVPTRFPLLFSDNIILLFFIIRKKLFAEFRTFIDLNGLTNELFRFIMK